MSPPHQLVVDSHVHLFASSHLSSLNWTSSLPSGHILKQQRSLIDYREDIKDLSRPIGLVLVEADRVSSRNPDGWIHSLDEAEFLLRAARGVPRADEGHTVDDKRLVLAIVPWAPVVAGPEALSLYLSRAKSISVGTTTHSLIKGFRYLVQDKPSGTMTSKEFVSALRMLGDEGFCFDLGLDSRSGGLWQLTEACTMLRHVYEGGRNLTTIINHCCKPNLHLAANEANDSNIEFAKWAESIRTLARFPQTFMKLSGFFSELPKQSQESPRSIEELATRLKPWIDVVFDAFTPSRIMFGSDWPVCTANGLGSHAWQRWYDLVTRILVDRGLSDEEKEMVWSGTAIAAYNIKIDDD